MPDLRLIIARKPLAYGLIYMGLSMVIEIMLLVVVRLKIPQDNAIIAPVLLVVSPVAAAVICGYRRPRELMLVTFLTILLTLLLVMGFGRVTGIVPPIFIRSAAGLMAALVVNRLKL